MRMNKMSDMLNDILYCVFNNEHDVSWWKTKSCDYFNRLEDDIISDLRKLADMKYIKVSFNGFPNFLNLSDIALTDNGVFYLLDIDKIDTFEYELRFSRELRDKML